MKQLGLSTACPIDVRMALNDQDLGPVIASYPEFGKNMQHLEEAGQAAMRLMDEWLASGTVGAMLYSMNDPEIIPHANRPYIEVFVPIVAG